MGRPGALGGVAGLSTIANTQGTSSLRSDNPEHWEGKSALPLTTQESLVRGHPFTQQIRSERLPWSPAEALGSVRTWAGCENALGQHGTEGQGARVPPASCSQERALLCGSELPLLLAGQATLHPR